MKYVKIIADSISEDGVRITTVEAMYPRMVHSELMTHRAFSRNASSSRAIPVKKLSGMDMYIPKFRENIPGMQPGGHLDPDTQRRAEIVWEQTARACQDASKELALLNAHKQWANRPLEWFGYIKVVMTATDWVNFIRLRTALNDKCLPEAQDEMYWLATELKSQLKQSYPVLLKETSSWHLPYVTPEEVESATQAMTIKYSVARCARVSYLDFDGKKPDASKDIALADRLLKSKHMSPFEHQAAPDPEAIDKHAWGNFRGWVQYRKLILGEDNTDVNEQYLPNDYVFPR